MNHGLCMQPFRLFWLCLKLYVNFLHLGHMKDFDLSTLKIWKLWILWAFAFVWIDLNFVFTVDLCELSTSLGFWTCQDAAWTFNFDFGHVIYELEHENLGICVTFVACQHLIFDLWTLNFEFEKWISNCERLVLFYTVWNV